MQEGGACQRLAWQMAPLASADDYDDTHDGGENGSHLQALGVAHGVAGGQNVEHAQVRASGASSAWPFLVREQAQDGNCLFRSFSDQLYGTPEHHALVRDRCSKYIAGERGYFEQFVAEPFDEFLARIRREGEWGDDVEIEALSEIYDCRVEIYGGGSRTVMRTFHEACDAERPHPIRLQYEGQSHYNSLVPRRGIVPLAKLIPGQHCQPGEIEDAAIARSVRRQEAGQRREGVGDGLDVERTDQEVLDESIRLSRQEFEHRSDAEMDNALERSRSEWDRSERRRMDEEVVDAILQQSVLDEEQKQLTLAMKESKELVMQNSLKYGSIYSSLAPSHSSLEPSGNPSSSSAAEGPSDAQEFQYPESVYAVMSMGFPLDKCIKAYHLVGDNPEGILAFCCQTLGL